MAESLPFNEDSVQFLETAAKSQFWRWVTNELEEEVSKITHQLAFGDLKIENPQQFWELRAKAQAIKALIELPTRRAAQITANLESTKNGNFVRRLFATSFNS